MKTKPISSSPRQGIQGSLEGSPEPDGKEEMETNLILDNCIAYGEFL